MPTGLDGFHPVVRRWFERRFGRPTPVQEQVWPLVAAGRHVLATAPTGSGKTLAAFLWALDRLCTGQWDGGTVRVLYVSPLRALVNDVRRNLAEPLAQLSQALTAEGAGAAPVRAAIRTGDTPPSERRRLLARPPELLVTTPESLNLLLTTPAGRQSLSGVRTVILDEIHAVAGTKRGTHLITAVERLTLLAGGFQRLALSATARPLEALAQWVGGWESSGDSWRRRPVDVVDAAGGKTWSVQVKLPVSAPEPGPARDRGRPIWEHLAVELAERVRANRSTLIFANSRRVVERMARLVNEQAESQLVYAHHGSLSREVRESVETRLKAGELAGIVATSSLELGIDIGTVDQVALVGTPPSIAAATQRIGRSGHGVGEVSRGLFHPVHPRDLLLAAVVARGVLDGEVEPVAPPAAPLDVLAQVVLSMLAARTWPLDRLHEFLRSADPYHDLPRRSFDLVVEMLAGRYAGSRLASLQPRIDVDRVTGTARARPAALALLHGSGGTIPDRGLFTMRLDAGAGASQPLGELDEEFVWERSEGDSFTLGGKSWRIRRITRNDVYVAPVGGRPAMAPFWRGEELDQSGWLAERAARFLEEADSRLDDPAFVRDLQARHCLDEPAAARLGDYLRGQRRVAGAPLPHRHHLVLEQTAEGALVFHTVWGGRVNRPFAMALAAAWEERFGTPLHLVHDDFCVIAEPPQAIDAAGLVRMVGPRDLDRLLRARLESTGFFGARFRENAGRALLLPRAGFGRRTPLWLSRQRAKDLLGAVKGHTDFPILLETWRTCMQDELEVARLRGLLEELADGRIAVSAVRTQSPSPFAADAVWKRVNQLVYEDDTPVGGPSRLEPGLLRQVALEPELRPRVAPAIAGALRRKLQRTWPGWAPRDVPELLGWLVERVLMPRDEWDELLAAGLRDGGPEREQILSETAARAVALVPPGEGEPFVCSVEWVPRLARALALGGAPRLLSARLDGTGASPEALAAVAAIAAADARAPDELPADLPAILGEWLRCCAPVPLEGVARLLGLSREAVLEAAQELADEDRVVIGELTLGVTGLELCDTENLERLLAMSRAAARPDLEPLPAAALPLFLAMHQGVTASQDAAPAEETSRSFAERPGGPETLMHALEPLLGWPVATGAWEEEVLPARLPAYRRSWLDGLFARSGLLWFGCGAGRVAFGLTGELDLFAAAASLPEEPAGPEEPSDLSTLLPSGLGRFTFGDLLQHTRLDSVQLTRRLWEAAFAGKVSCDGFAAVRQGRAARFTAGPAGLTGDARSAPHSSPDKPEPSEGSRAGVPAGPDPAPAGSARDPWRERAPRA